VHTLILNTRYYTHAHTISVERYARIYCSSYNYCPHIGNSITIYVYGKYNFDFGHPENDRRPPCQRSTLRMQRMLPSSWPLLARRWLTRTNARFQNVSKSIRENARYRRLKCRWRRNVCRTSRISYQIIDAATKRRIIFLRVYSNLNIPRGAITSAILLYRKVRAVCSTNLQLLIGSIPRMFFTRNYFPSVSDAQLRTSVIHRRARVYVTSNMTGRFREKLFAFSANWSSTRVVR